MEVHQDVPGSTMRRNLVTRGVGEVGGVGKEAGEAESDAEAAAGAGKLGRRWQLGRDRGKGRHVPSTASALERHRGSVRVKLVLQLRDRSAVISSVGERGEGDEGGCGNGDGDEEVAAMVKVARESATGSTTGRSIDGEPW